MLSIDYKRGMGQSIIDTATFNLEYGRQLVLSIIDVPDKNDPEKAVGQNVRVAIKDGVFEEEMSVEIGLKDGVDLIRILQRVFRQAASFVPAVNDDGESTA